MPKDETDLPHFTRDRDLAADVADEFGGGAGNAEQLIEANALRFSPDLENAQLLPGESGLEDEKRRRPDASFTIGEVAKAASLDVDSLDAYEIHGDFVVFAYTTPDERTHKEVLRITKSNGLEAIKDDSPQRAAIRAQIEASTKVKAAKESAKDIIAEARAEADKIIAQAAAKAEDERVEAVQKAAPKPASKSGGKKATPPKNDK